jgi:undecaprenyl-diphosphatase
MYSSLQIIHIQIFQWLNNLTGNSEFFNILVIYTSDIPLLLIPPFLIGLWIFGIFSKNTSLKSLALFLFISTIFAIMINLIIQQFFHFQRPEAAISAAGKLLLDHLPDASFPSDHTTAGFAFASSFLFLGYKKIGSMVVIIMLCMSLSRVIAGVHWPIDILAGALLGISSSFFICKTYHNFFTKKIWPSLYKIAGFFRL